MVTLSGDRPSPSVPLAEEDWQILEELFEKLELEELQQIEAVSTSFAIAPLEAWEEVGWLVSVDTE